LDAVVALPDVVAPRQEELRQTCPRPAAKAPVLAPPKKAPLRAEEERLGGAEA
jgi:hypothetical protein